MKTVVCKDYAEMSAVAASHILAVIQNKKNAVLGLATGSTPEGMYDVLVDAYTAGKADFSDVISYNLDEYYPITDDNAESYHTFMRKHLFSRVNIKPENTHLLSGTAADPARECADYDKAIENAGNIDIQVLGIGENGHIGFNEPGETLLAATHVTPLTESTIRANARFFDNDLSKVPTHALTAGLSPIMKSREIIILASGAKKKAAVRALLDDVITTAVPATMLKMHPNVTLICTEDAI